MMWIFEWDIVTGDSAALDSIYAVSRDDLDVRDRRRRRRGRGRRGHARRRSPATDPAHVALPRAVRVVRRRARLRDRPAAARSPPTARPCCGTRSGSTPAARRRTTQWRPAEQRVPRRARRARRALRRATSTCPRTTSPPPTSAASAPTATPRWRGSARGAARRGRCSCCVLGLHGAARPAVRPRCARCSSRRPGRGGSARCPAPTTRADRVARLGAAGASCSWPAGCVYTWFAAPAHLVVTLGAWLRPRRRAAAASCGRRDPFHLWAALGGVVLLRTVILLVALAVRGPGRYWFGFWTDPTSRTVYITVAFAAFCWLFVVDRPRAAPRLRAARRPGRRRDRSLAGGLTLAVVAGGVAAIGLEQALTVWNDQMALLPWGLSPDPRHHRLPRHPARRCRPSLAVVGLVVAVVGAVPALLARRPARTSAP